MEKGGGSRQTPPSSPKIQNASRPNDAYDTQRQGRPVPMTGRNAPPQKSNSADTSAFMTSWGAREWKYYENGQCFNCGAQGHIGRNCPHPRSGNPLPTAGTGKGKGKGYNGRGQGRGQAMGQRGTASSTPTPTPSTSSTNAAPAPSQGPANPT